MVVVARALSVDPADEPHVEVRVAVELLVETRVLVVADERPPEVLCGDELARELRHRRPVEVGVRRNPLAQPRPEFADASDSAQLSRAGWCVGLENVPHSIAETADGIQCRSRVHDGRVAPVHELADAERLDAELDRPSSVRGDVEERVRVERRADVDAAAREALELERPASGEHREDEAQRRPALACRTRARRGTPPASAPDSRSPSPTTPVASRPGCGRRPGARRRASRSPRPRRASALRASRSASSDEPSDTPTKPSRGTPGENASSLPPALATSARVPSTHASSSSARSPSGSASSPRLVCSETTATSTSSRSSVRSRPARS